MLSHRKETNAKNIFISIFFLCFISIIISLSPNCKSNINNCNKCNPITNLCEICNNPEIFSPNAKGGCSGAINCISGQNYCIQCDQNGELCKKCFEGYTPDENGGCTYTANCQISFNGECLECKDNFFKSGKKGGLQICKSYSSEDFLHCANITYETGFCNSCEEGYFLSSEKRCIKTENCAESIFGICISCKEGYYFNKLTDKCELKLDNFVFCKQSLDNKTCEICEENYYFDEDGICIPNKYCSKSINFTCVKCIEGYNLISNKSVCVQSDNCIEGDKDLGMCTKCKDTFYLDGNDRICKTNLESNEFMHCTKTEEGKCIECEKNYYLGEDYKCSFTENCAESKLGVCFKCAENYYLGYDNYCTRYEHCIYSSHYYCLECEDGFYFNRKNKTCYNYTEYREFENCKYSCEYAERCCKCKDNFYLRSKDNKCLSNQEEGPFYKCEESDEEGEYCINCIEPYFLGIDDDLCSLVEACAKIENEFRCKECIEYYCLDVNKGICIDNDLVENETNIIYFACLYTNKEGTACEKCLDGYEVGKEGYCVDNERCIEKENSNGVCLKCQDGYCANDIYGCVDSHYLNCIRCNNIYDLYGCTQCEEGYKINNFGACDPIPGEEENNNDKKK